MSNIKLTCDWAEGSFSTKFKLAEQIRNLINNYNDLSVIYETQNILCRSKEYLALVVSGVIIGCIRIDRQSYTFTELRHLSVLKSYRGSGLGYELIKESLSKITTPMVYATIRDNNIPSLGIFGSLGFVHGYGYINESGKRVYISTAATATLIKEHKLKYNCYS